MNAQPPTFFSLSPEQRYAQYQWMNGIRGEVGAHVRKLSVEAVKHLLLVNSAGLAAMLGFAAALRLQSGWLVLAMIAFVCGIGTAGFSWGVTYHRLVDYMNTIARGFDDYVAGRQTWEKYQSDVRQLDQARDWGLISAWLSLAFLIVGGAVAAYAVWISAAPRS